MSYGDNTGDAVGTGSRERSQQAVSAVPASIPIAWECFRDAAYYDMWCVRPVGSRTFGEGFHLVNRDEAEGLRDLLNRRG